MAVSADAADCRNFSLRLEDLKAVPVEPTLDEFDRYAPSSRESELASLVCRDDCVMSLVSEEARRLLCLAAIRANRPLLTILLGHQISEDKALLDYFRLFFPTEVRAVSSESPLEPTTFEDICLVEPDVLRTCLVSGALNKYSIGTLIFLDFQHYLDPRHVYRYVVELYQNELGIKEPASTRLLAFTGNLEVSSVRNLESILKALRTPLRLKCCLGTPARPHSKDIDITIHPLDIDWESVLGYTLSSSDDPDVQEVAATLREGDIVAARKKAEEAAAAKPSRELRQFLLCSHRLMSGMKEKIVLDYARGRTLALTSSVASQQEIKKWLEKSSASVMASPHDEDLTFPAVLVATLADIPTLKEFWWETVVLCDLPFGVSCDPILFVAGRAVALATGPELKKWKDALALHDQLDRLLRRVNK